MNRAPWGWWHRYSLLIDVALVAAVLAYGLPILPQVPGADGRVGLLTVISLALGGAYLARHRWPWPAFAGMVALALLHRLLGAPLIVADLLLLPALFHLASRRPPLRSIPAPAVLFGWVAVAVIPNRDDLFLGFSEIAQLILLILLVWTWGVLVRVRRDYVTGLEERARHLERERAQQARIGAAQERARIAREMHDIVSHGLSAMVVMSDAAAGTVGTDPDRARSAMIGVRDTGRTALTEMRRMLGVLREESADAGTPQPGIRQLPELIAHNRDAGLPVDLIIDPDLPALPAGLDLAVYRIIQEALTNARRHAHGATSVEVTVRIRAAHLHIEITDDGTGAPGAGAAGHGLVGMRERVTAYGGDLRAGPLSQGGFRVHARLPVDRATEEA